MPAPADEPSRHRVLMIGLDAAAAPLIEQMLDAGELPHLQRLRDAGGYGRLASTAHHYVSSVWPSFAMAAGPEETGCYHYLQWDMASMRLNRIKASWMLREPFWRNLGAQGRKVLALDVPYVTVPEPFDGVEISGWGTHDLIFDAFTHPPQLRRDVIRRFGASAHRVGDAMSEEKYEPEPMADRMKLRDQLVSTTRRVTDMGEALLAEQSWDFALIVLGGPHRGGHHLWDSSGVSDASGPEADAQIQEALKCIYREADASVGRLVAVAERCAAEAQQELCTFAFALHGMGPNYGRTDILPEMIDRVVHDGEGTAPGNGNGNIKGKGGGTGKSGVLHRLRHMLPNSVRFQVKSRLPHWMQDRLSAYWRLGGRNWKNTSAFSVTADVHGYVRFNLKGRERDGIVEPGAEYDAMCEQLREGLLSYRDADTGEPIAKAVHRTDQLVPDHGRRDCLPDLVVEWADTPCARHRAVVSDRFGRIDWPTPGKSPNGRSGNHQPEGWLIAGAPGFAPGSVIRGAHMLDLPPTVLHLLELEAPSWMRGRAINGAAVSGSGARQA